MNNFEFYLNEEELSPNGRVLINYEYLGTMPQVQFIDNRSGLFIGGIKGFHIEPGKLMLTIPSEMRPIKKNSLKIVLDPAARSTYPTKVIPED